MVVTMTDLDIHYSMSTFSVERQNGEMYSIFLTGWHLIFKQARLYPFMTLPIPTQCHICNYKLCLWGLFHI